MHDVINNQCLLEWADLCLGHSHGIPSESNKQKKVSLL